MECRGAESAAELSGGPSSQGSSVNLEHLRYRGSPPTPPDLACALSPHRAACSSRCTPSTCIFAQHHAESAKIGDYRAVSRTSGSATLVIRHVVLNPGHGRARRFPGPVSSATTLVEYTPTSQARLAGNPDRASLPRQWRPGLKASENREKSNPTGGRWRTKIERRSHPPFSTSSTSRINPSFLSTSHFFSSMLRVWFFPLRRLGQDPSR